nr:VanW family protein [Paenibacillus turpanensis]
MAPAADTAGSEDADGTQASAHPEAAPDAPAADGTLRLELPITIVQPKVTTDALKAQGIDRRIAHFSTAYRTSSEGRVHNIESTASVIHDQLLAPGEVFDYGKAVRETEKKFGYRSSTVIIDGNFAPGVGGGICQVSTTLYGAVLRAGLEIVERKNHSLPISYVPKGQDATFSSGWINFRFRNNTGSHLLIRTQSNHNVLTVKLFGRMDPAVSYSIKSEVVETLQPPVKYIKDNSLPKGSVKLLKTGKTGYIVETYRYKLVNGKIESKEKISRDTYKPQPSTYASNADHRTDAPAPGQEAPLMIEDGVSGPLDGIPQDQWEEAAAALDGKQDFDKYE